MFDSNAVLFVIIALSLALVGFMAWAAEQDGFDKIRSYLGYGIFVMIAVFGGALYSIYDDSEFEYSDWDIKEKKKKDGKQNGGGGGGGSGGGGQPGGGGGSAQAGGAPGGQAGAAAGMPDEAPGEEEEAAAATEEETAEEEEKEKKEKTFSDCSKCPEMVRIPAGVALLGSPIEVYSGNAQTGPPMQVTIRRGYAIGRYEVKVREFRAFVKETGYRSSQSCEVAGHVKPGANYRRPGFRQDKDAPAVCVSWLDAQAYVDWLNKISGRRYRLPTEVEWEYAARAGVTGPYQSYDMLTFNEANYNDVAGPAAGGTTKAGTYGENGFGLSDVHGNAWELVQDCWSRGYQVASARRGGQASVDCGRRMMKGGGWRSSVDQLRFSMRSPVGAEFASDTVGFRVVRD